MIVNGVTLPDIPDEAKVYSNFMVMRYIQPGNEAYLLIGCAGGTLVVKDSSPLDPSMPDVYPSWLYLSKPFGIYERFEDGEWTFDSGVSGTGYQKFPMPMVTAEVDGELMSIDVFWADHVIMEATLDGSGVPVSTGVQYYPKEPKPTRVSIGRSLMNGYAKEVQRLTGTTDQMNAVQIQEKLSAVKAGIKIGDVVLPAFPESWNDTFIAVCYLSNEETPYVALAGDGELLHFSQDDYGIIGTKGNGIVIAQCTPGAAEWEMKTISYEGYQYPKYTGSGICWSNHDIYEITSINEDTGEFTTGDVYCLTSQNFNGVWLPKIPDGFFAEKPYGFLFRVNYNGEDQYFLVKSHGKFLFLPEDVLGQIGSDPSILGGAVGFVTSEIEEPLSSLYCSSESTNWMTGKDQENAVPIGQFGEMYYYELLWANHDIYAVASVDMNGGGVILGNLYFPPLPAIDTDRVSIGYDLCDGIVEEVQRLSGESEKMNALRAYWKLTTVN